MTAPNHRFFTVDDFEAAARSAIGKAAQGTMDIGVVYATLGRIADGDPKSWLVEWKRTGDEQKARALSARDARHEATAAYFFLAAADAYVHALGFIDGLPDDAELLPTFRAHRACWDAFIDVSGGRHVRVDVPFDGATMPGYLLRPDASGTRRSTVVITNGSDAALSGVWAEGIKAALDRGRNVFVFDGPGQQTLLFEHDIPFRYDWEAVLTPVVDLLVQRKDVDPSKLLAYGLSQGGYWLARALAFEHRFVAAVLDGGIVDVSRAWYANLPEPLLGLLRSGDAAQFNAFMASGPDDPVQARVLAFRARPYGAFETPFELFTAVGKFALDASLIGAIETPVLVIDPEDEQFFPGQSRELYAALTCPKVLERFTREEGANFHCQPLARTRTGLVMNDFFDERLRIAARARG